MTQSQEDAYAAMAVQDALSSPFGLATVDNQMLTDVPHWPAFAAWWASRRCRSPRRGNCTFGSVDAASGLHKIPLGRSLCP